MSDINDLGVKTAGRQIVHRDLRGIVITGQRNELHHHVIVRPNPDQATPKRVYVPKRIMVAEGWYFAERGQHVTIDAETDPQGVSGRLYATSFQFTGPIVGRNLPSSDGTKAYVVPNIYLAEVIFSPWRRGTGYLRVVNNPGNIGDLCLSAQTARNADYTEEDLRGGNFVTIDLTKIEEDEKGDKKLSAYKLARKTANRPSVAAQLKALTEAAAKASAPKN